MDRREFLSTGVVTSSALFAGCVDSVESLFETRTQPEEPPVVENRPDAVYYPTHIEGMEMAGMTEGDWYTVALSYSFPHRFWTVTGQETERVSVRGDDSIHLMMNVWDTETGVVVPVASQTVELAHNDEVIDQRSLWPMLSQSMGYHFGDNVALSSEGTYTATIRLSPIDAIQTGAFADKFDESVTVDIEFEYSQRTRDELAFEEFPEQQGERGAVDPMEMETMPLAETPAPSELPGVILGENTSGNAVFLVTIIEDATHLGTDGTYLAVSPRTPYNGFPLPFMSLSATLTRNGEAIFDDALRAVLDPTLRYHYGASVESVEPGDTITISVDSPPQVSRHEGYETAFLSMPDIEFDM